MGFEPSANWGIQQEITSEYNNVGLGGTTALVHREILLPTRETNRRSLALIWKQ
jgi:hypothetical protein